MKTRDQKRRTRQTLLIAVLLVGLGGTVCLLTDPPQVHHPRSIEEIDTRQDLKMIIGSIVKLKKEEMIDLGDKTGRNLNEDRFGQNMLKLVSDVFRFDWLPVHLSINAEGNWIDSRGNLIFIVYFGDEEEAHAREEMRSLAQRYRFAVWAIGRNEINEYGSGDDVFVGLSRDGDYEFEVKRFERPWWRFW